MVKLSGLMAVPQKESAIDTDVIMSAPWYHTIAFPGGVTTPGQYDLRPIIDRLPWPDLRRLRCLDVGGRDGFLAFEMERRGAAEVVSLDVGDPADIHFPSFRPPTELVQNDLDNGDRAFNLAREALGSSVERRLLSVYELRPDNIGMFDFAVIGTLLLHLRDPVAALCAINGVLAGRLLVNEAISPSLDLLRRRPMTEALMIPGRPFWSTPNPRGLARIVVAAGFEVVEMGRPYLVPYGAGAEHRTLLRCFSRPVRDIPRKILQRYGALHCWLLAQPAAGKRQT